MRSVMDCFRPFVRSQQWDYVVLWKLGNDPTRFIEWMECCCRGGCEIVKEEKNDMSLPLCRDVALKHYVRTKACESLSVFPSSMDLYSGIHSEVVISRQPTWINQDDGNGTRAFFPIESGLIEFYSTKNIPKDQRVLDMILANCKMVCFDQKVTSSLDPHPKRGSTLNHSFDRLMLLDDSNTDQIENDEKDSREDGSVPFGCKSVKRTTKRKENGEYQSKNLIAERERRKKIKNGLLVLRSLVPNITKMDMASILRDAVKYIEDMRTKETGLRGELSEIEDREKEHKCRERKRGVVIVLERQPEAKVEVNQINEREFFVKLFTPHKLGGFVRLLEAIDSFNLEVVWTNSTAFNQGVVNILQLKAEKDIEPNILRDFFTKLSV